MAIISGSLWQDYGDEPFINNDAIIDVPDDPDSASFKYNRNKNWNKNWNKKCSNNGTIKIFKYFIESS